MTTHEVPDALRVEGFRTRRSFGFGGMSKGATIAVAGALAADGIIATSSPETLVVTLPVTLVAAALKMPPLLLSLPAVAIKPWLGDAK